MGGVRVRGAGDASVNGWYSLRENDGTMPMVAMKYPVTPLRESTLSETQWMEFSQGQPWFCKSSPHAGQCYIWWCGYSKAWILNKDTRPQYHSRVPAGLPEKLPSVWEAVQCSPFGLSAKTTPPKMRQYQYRHTAMRPVAPAPKADTETSAMSAQKRADYTKSISMIWGATGSRTAQQLYEAPESDATRAVEAVITALDTSQPGWRSRFNKNWRVRNRGGDLILLNSEATEGRRHPGGKWKNSRSTSTSTSIVNGVKVKTVRETSITNGKKVEIIKETSNGNTTKTKIETDLCTGKITRTFR